jgi:hypothetical protein
LIRLPLAAIFGLPQYGQRSGGLTGDDGGDLAARLDMRVFVARGIEKVTDLQERVAGCWSRIRKEAAGCGPVADMQEAGRKK